MTKLIDWFLSSSKLFMETGQLARKVEAVNPTKEPLKSDLLDGKWELIYTTSASILQAKVTTC